MYVSVIMEKRKWYNLVTIKFLSNFVNVGHLRKFSAMILCRFTVPFTKHWTR